MKILIPLCGKGSRFYPENKPFVKVFGKPILEHVIGRLSVRPTIIVNDRTYTKELEQFGDVLNIHKETQGASETILEALLQMNIGSEGILCVDGDNFYGIDIIRKISQTPEKNQIVVFQDRNPNAIYSYVKINGDKKIFEICEKEKISQYANTGAYYFSNASEFIQNAKEVLDRRLFLKGEPYLSAVIHLMLQKKIDFYPVEIEPSSYISLGTPEQVKFYKQNTYGFLFDLDGTLVETEHIYYKVWEQILEEYNIQLTKEIYQQFIYSNSDSYVQKTLLRSCSVEEISKKKDSYFLQRIGEIGIVSGAHRFLAYVFLAGYPIGIVTNSNRATAEKILEQVGLNDFVSELVVSSECLRAKPYPDPYEKAIHNFGIPANRCIVFEDSPNGILSARGVAPKCIVGIGSNAQTADKIKKDFTELCLEELFVYTENKLVKYKKYIYKSMKKRYPFLHHVEISPLTLKGGFIADVYQVEIKESGKEHKLIFKVENNNSSELNRIAHELDLYNRENYFYESVSQHVPIKTPYFYGLVADDDMNVIGILLENLNKKDFTLNLNLNKEPIETSFSIICEMAKLHASCWGKNLDTKFTGLKKNSCSKFQLEFVLKKVPEFMKKWDFLFTPKQRSILEKVGNTYKEIQEHLSIEPLTLVHGDVKSPNIFYEKKGNEVIPYFIDWQYICYGKGVQDLVFFMIESFSGESMDKYFYIFREMYYVKLLENEIKGYSHEEYLKDFENAAYYFPFFVAVWFGTTSTEDLIDVNFPYFFILKYLHFLDKL
jgi:HAD superfamily hydrolase (TIGR01509 family)